MTTATITVDRKTVKRLASERPLDVNVRLGRQKRLIGSIVETFIDEAFDSGALDEVDIERVLIGAGVDIDALMDINEDFEFESWMLDRDSVFGDGEDYVSVSSMIAALHHTLRFAVEDDISSATMDLVRNVIEDEYDQDPLSWPNDLVLE